MECSYLVKTAEGHLIRRNWKFLRATGESAETITNQVWLPTEVNKDNIITTSPEPQQDTPQPELQKEIQEEPGQNQEPNTTVELKKINQDTLSAGVGTDK